jgi:hypothetical protein
MQCSAQVCLSVPDIPGRSAAEQALAAALAGGRPSFTHAVVVTVPEAEALFESGQYQQADNALLATFLSLAQGRPSGDQVFRWSAASLLLLTTENTEFETLADGIYPAAGRPGVFPFSLAPSLDVLKRDIDLVVALSSGT